MKRLLITLKRSIFLRLLIIFSLTIVILLTLVTLTLAYFSDPNKFLHNKALKNFEMYAELLIDRIGTPPNYEIAQQLSRDLGLGMVIKTQSDTWQSDNYQLPANVLVSKQHVHKSGAMTMGHSRGLSYLLVQRNATEYRFVFSHRRFTDQRSEFLISLLLIIIVALATCYFMVRWLFRPIRDLNQGVREISAGNFDFRIQNNRTDEFGLLSDGFNNMSAQIKKMVKEKEQLLLDVSHELRSPMTRMKVALEFINDHQTKNSIEEDLTAMDHMISELLESARLNSPRSQLHKQTIALIPLIEEVASQFNGRQPGIKISSDQSDLTINADRDRISICLRNIIENAMKFSAQQKLPVEVHCRGKEQSISIDITDFGLGIPAADLPHLFEPFYRVDKSRNQSTGGYGLGLSLSKNIIEAHGGTISVSSTEKHKTMFQINLPKT